MKPIIIRIVHTIVHASKIVGVNAPLDLFTDRKGRRCFQRHLSHSVRAGGGGLSPGGELPSGTGLLLKVALCYGLLVYPPTSRSPYTDI